jgi:hypothetical protein
MLDQKKKEQTCHRPKAKFPYGIQPEELQDILNKIHSRTENVFTWDNKKKEKKKYIALPEP